MLANPIVQFYPMYHIRWRSPNGYGPDDMVVLDQFECILAWLHAWPWLGYFLHDINSMYYQAQVGLESLGFYYE